jgi:hypothetical protein
VNVWNLLPVILSFSDSPFLPWECRKLHNGELHDLYSPLTIVRVMKSRRVRRAGHVARLVEGRGVYKVLVGKPEGNNTGETQA